MQTRTGIGPPEAMRRGLFIIPALVLVLCAREALAHEFWIEPRKYQVAAGAEVEAGLLNGQMFKGVELAWYDGRVAEASWAAGGRTGVFAGRAGDRPALRIDAAPEGLVRMIYQSAPSELSYASWEKFRNFAEGKGNGWAVERHLARGLPKSGIRERYVRYSKALVASGNGAGADARAGLRHEIVARDNPYTLTGESVGITLWLDDRPLGDGQIDLFEMAPDGSVAYRMLVSDGRGAAQIPVRRGHRYLINSVVLQEGQAGDVAWLSLWASLSFAVPE